MEGISKSYHFVGVTLEQIWFVSLLDKMHDELMSISRFTVIVIDQWFARLLSQFLYNSHFNENGVAVLTTFHK